MRGTSVIRSGLAAAVVAVACVASLLAVPHDASAAPFPWEFDVRTDLATLPTNHSPAPFAVDWNNDGLMDVVTGFRSATQYGGIGVFLRNSDGSFPSQPMSAFVTGTTASSTIGFALYFRPVVADWDGDGDKDLLFGQYSGHKGVVACLNEGTDSAPLFDGTKCAQLKTQNGTLVGQTTPDPGPSNIAYVSPEVVDWDDDGDLDLLVGTGLEAKEKGVRLYEMVADEILRPNGLAEPVEILSRADTPGLANEVYYEPTVVDFDDDGDKDLLIAGSMSSSERREFVLRQCLNESSLTDLSPRFTCSGIILPGLVNNVVDATDWDGDDRVDLLRGFHSSFINNTVTLLFGKGLDRDGDGVSDHFDNCADVPNPARLKLDKETPVQLDTDDDGAGDPCDDDLDGDASANASDNCLLTANGAQTDGDGDSLGDTCDPRDDRSATPGVGSYEWEMANLMEWGRKPVIMMRADAMSIGYRQDIAEILTLEALERDMAFTLAVIPWDDARFSKARGTQFIREHGDDPDLEISQHGTYHTCVLGDVKSGDEFGSACGMGEPESFNLMRVGKQAMNNALAPITASHELTGFIPPADAANNAAVVAARALGYRYFASAYYREPQMFHIDGTGMVHLPWSQIACGNGAASWTNCGVANLEAHSGVDCADPDLCRPTREPAPKDYSNWSTHADARLAERCRNDLSRYEGPYSWSAPAGGGGVCAILFELTSFDANFATGEPDPNAILGYEQTLDELKAMAAEEGAIFMTLGQYAAAVQMQDTTAPDISVSSDVAGMHEHHEILALDVDVTDDVSGVYDLDITLNGEAIPNGTQLDLLTLPVGDHTLAVRAEDTAGNVGETSVTFTVDATLTSLKGAVERYLADGRISDHRLGSRLLARLDAAISAAGAGDSEGAADHVAAFAREVRARRARHIEATAADLLLSDADVVRQRLLSS